MLDLDGIYPLDDESASHLFACLNQIHRAFFQIFNYVPGDSIPVAQLRAKVWESIFSFDLRRYYCGLFDRMRDLSTLVTGPSGTGKELVARAIGLSQYVPFSLSSMSFSIERDRHFSPLNLSALSPTLIESELFGHCKSSFTGAVSDRVGWLETCSPHGAVFLDEIGELDQALQVKLLRVVRQRTYCSLGETKQREFCGKFIAATNRNLTDEINAGNFRADFYFRLCSDRIETPTLREQLDDKPTDLCWLVLFVARRLAGNDAGKLADEATEWIEKNLGSDYPWSGNIRELEQCVSSFMIRREYVPAGPIGCRPSAAGGWTQPIADCRLTAEELLSRYCTRIYSQCDSYEKTAQKLKIDRRTVKAKVDERQLEEFRANE